MNTFGLLIVIASVTVALAGQTYQHASYWKDSTNNHQELPEASPPEVNTGTHWDKSSGPTTHTVVHVAHQWKPSERKCEHAEVEEKEEEEVVVSEEEQQEDAEVNQNVRHQGGQRISKWPSDLRHIESGILKHTTVQEGSAVYKSNHKPEILIHRPSPIIVQRPPTQVLVNHPPLIVKPAPVIWHRPAPVVVQRRVVVQPHQHRPIKEISIARKPQVIVQKPVETKLVQKEQLCKCDPHEWSNWSPPQW